MVIHAYKCPQLLCYLRDLNLNRRQIYLIGIQSTYIQKYRQQLPAHDHNH